MRYLGFLVSAICALQVNAFASSSCSNIDVRDSLPADVKTFMTTPSDQGDIGWCYGYTAADIISQALGTPVSALHLSAYYSSEVTVLGKIGRGVVNKTTTPEGGMVGVAVRKMYDLGYACKERDIPSQGTKEIWLSSTTKVHNGMAFFINRMKDIRAGKCVDLCEKSFQQLAEGFFPGTSPDVIRKYLLTHRNVSLEDVVFFFLDNSCRFKSTPIPNSLNYETWSKKTHPFESINSQINWLLNRRKLISLEYDASEITDVGGIFGAAHASTIVGRKKIGNACYYMVRNSWGTSCDYRKDIICLKDQGTYLVHESKMKDMAKKLIWIN
ncbi:hypothetical protein ACLVWU_02625 [Bdellovibrio sp. HCB290]|uniref:hypothetical protein n=1 Tax=Bdellovibrio sp. HCB290 TaxID=3394356 RepID=UPI0039B549C2